MIARTVWILGGLAALTWFAGMAWFQPFTNEPWWLVGFLGGGLIGVLSYYLGYAIEWAILIAIMSVLVGLRLFGVLLTGR